MSTGPLQRGSVIGILGGGQLGRMLSMAAARLGFETHIYSPAGDNPAFAVSHTHTQADFADQSSLQAFAHACDTVTYEWENVPVDVCDLIDTICPVRPGPDVLRISQDRVAEKTFVSGLGIPVPEFHPAGSLSELEQAVAHIGRPGVLKTRRFGYDGKGQTHIKEETVLADAWDTIREQPAILEAFVPFDREVSVIAARERVERRWASHLELNHPQRFERGNGTKTCDLIAGIEYENLQALCAFYAVEAFELRALRQLESSKPRDLTKTGQ